MLFDDRLTRRKVEPHDSFIISRRACERRQHGAHVAGHRGRLPGQWEYFALAPAVDEEIWVEDVVDAPIFIERDIERGVDSRFDWRSSCLAGASLFDACRFLAAPLRFVPLPQFLRQCGKLSQRHGRAATIPQSFGNLECGFVRLSRLGMLTGCAQCVTEPRV